MKNKMERIHNVLAEAMGTKILCNARDMSRRKKLLRLFPTRTTARFVVPLRRSVGVFLRLCKTISVDF